MRSIIFALLLFSGISSHASNAQSFKLKPNENCTLNQGDYSSIPVLNCYISLGLQAQDAEISDISHNIDTESLPFFSDYGTQLGFAPEVINLNGNLVLVVSFLDDSLDGYDISEAKEFKKEVIKSFQAEDFEVSVFIKNSNVKVGSSFGKVLKVN